MIQEEYLGVNFSCQLSEIINKLAPNKILLVRGKSSYDSCGARFSIERALYGKKIEIVEFYDFQENPKIEEVEIGLELLKSNEIDLIIGVGGGSVLDMAKLLRFFYSYSYDSSFSNFVKAKYELLPLIAVPTTSGTGCESTHFAVVYKDKVKYSVAHKDVLPNIAIVDPIFTYNLPKYLTACTGFDALSQAIEAYWNVNATDESDEYALQAIKLLWSNLPIAVNNPTVDIRNIVSRGAHLAGKAINITKTTAPHAFSYFFTSNYNIPHGHAVALTFPFFMYYNYCHEASLLSSRLELLEHHNKMDVLYEHIGCEKNNAIEYMKKYLDRLNFNVLETINYNNLIASVNIERLNNNPVKITNNVSPLLKNNLYSVKSAALSSN